MTGRDDLGDRMKGYEAAETARRFEGRHPLYARLDGRGFSRFARGLRRPFDARMSEAMMSTAESLIEETGATIAYTQSDEISLLWRLRDDATEAAQIFFDGKVMKLASVLASYATAAFTAAILATPDQDFRAYAKKLPHFDTRLFQVPSDIEAANAFLWRENDASRNAVQMVAHDQYSHRSLHKMSTSEMLDRLTADGCRMEEFPGFFRYGTYLKRRLVERPLSAAERERIPELHRPAPDALVQRHEIVRFQMPRNLPCEDRVSIICGSAFPVTADRANEPTSLRPRTTEER